ncbi:HAMP domain-containing histidine kinase [Patescibacteria group bacterium]|nr:HAMP domain-containing histidine kinase [Patescibacteria group bacterium]MBU1868007.1 HAMP domain-containing histidine kinase [Patescibacteria group bacterium]
MEDKSQQTKADPKLETVQTKSVELVVCLVRILVRFILVAALFWSKNIYAIPLTAYLFVSEMGDCLTIYLAKTKPEFKEILGILHVLNATSVTLVISLLTGWVFNDFYLVFLINIVSASLAYGLITSMTSAILSISTYSTLLYIYHAPLTLYLRLPLLTSVAILILIDGVRYQNITSYLTHVLSIEKAKQDFIAIASHNLRTPVAAIYGYIELLLSGDTGPLNEDQSSCIDKIKRNNRELEQLSEQVLQISILALGEAANLFKQPSQVGVIIEDVIHNVTSRAQKKGLKLTYLKPNYILPLVDIDIEKITAVLNNLVDNAIKYTETGKVTVAAKNEGGYVVISVIDTGIGIPKADLPKIFSQFYRAGNILVYNQPGLGLGLYLGKRIVDLHNGRITVTSMEGVGTTLTLSLPVTRDSLD